MMAFIEMPCTRECFDLAGVEVNVDDYDVESSVAT